MTEQTFRLRYEPATEKFVLIGLDIIDRDRAAGEVVEESTNFITGLKIVKRSRYNERLSRYVTTSTTRSQVAKKRVAIEQVEHEQYYN